MERRQYNRIKVVLAEKRLTNNWLADRLKKSKATVSRWCTNEMQPSVETLFEIADVLDVDVRVLLASNREQ